MARTSKIYLAKNIKLDKNYRAVLNYSESDMISLITNNANLVYYQANYQFIRESNVIQIKAPYSTVCGANYMAFQNPDYSNKYFFAFIDDIKYLNENATEIRYTIDIWTTWYDYWSAKACYVIREHVVDDTLGANLVPENLDLGEYVINSHLSDSYNNDLVIVTASTVGPSDLESYTMNVYNGLPAPVVYCKWNPATQLDDLADFINDLNGAGKITAMVGMFLAPSWLCPSTIGTVYIDESSTVEHRDLGISRIASLDGYTPVNKKLLTYPFCYIGVSNVVGQYATYKQEFWQLNNDNEMVIRMYGVLTSGCSIRACPLNYRKDGVNFDESIVVGKFSQLAWSNDVYTNWLTQNGINILGIPLDATTTGYLASGGQLLSGIAMKDAKGIASGVGGIIETMKTDYQHSLVPNQVEGSLNSGDVTNLMGANRLHAYRMSITYNYASRIDKYLTRMGYKVNTIKVPNMGYRQNYNFVQIANDDNVAYPNDHNNICVPATALNDINNLFRNGITIWNNHTNLGDYSVTNSIVTPTP